MKTNLTELIFILDKSGSMQGLEGDTIGGFNSMLEKQKAVKGEAYVTTVLFDDGREIIHDRAPIAQVSLMTNEQYQVGGCTALLDAIGNTVTHISTIHKYAREEDIPEHTMVAIMTDGMENASHQYNFTSIKKLIKAQEEKGWQFIFMGANIDAVELGDKMGIRRENSVTFANDSEGQKINYDALSKAASDMRNEGFLGACIFDEVVTHKMKVDGKTKKK